MEHIIELWQQATIDETRMDKVFQTEDLVPMIIKLEQKQQRLIRFKTLSSLILSLALLILFLNRTTITLYSSLGIGIFISSLLAVVVLLNHCISSTYVICCSLGLEFVTSYNLTSI